MPGESAKWEGSRPKGRVPRGLPAMFNPSLCGPSSSMVTSPSVANGGQPSPHWKPAWAGRHHSYLFTDEMLELGVNSLPTLRARGSALIWLPLFKNIVYIQSFLFGCAGSSLLPGFLSGCGRWGHLFTAVWILLLQSTDSRLLGLSRHSSRALEQRRTVVVCRLSCSVAGGIFPDRGWKPRLLH